MGSVGLGENCRSALVPPNKKKKYKNNKPKMAKFLTGNKLNSEVEAILENAYAQLILISPYIKLHERYISVLKSKKDNSDLEIIVVFGKNEEDLSKSLKAEDLRFFTEFPNIEIRYEKRLHAKYYANENSALITSMNLYSYSQDNNIEAGILTKSSLLNNLTGGILSSFTGGDSFEGEAFEYFSRVIQQAELLYKKAPEFDSSLMGLKKKYKGSNVLTDKIDEFFNKNNKITPDKNEYNKPNSTQNNNKPNFIPNSSNKPTQTPNGYCIRTGREIPFNSKKPFSDDAYNSWLKFKNEDYPEKYCHYSGEPSNGETSFSKPILKKNWQKAKEIHRL